VYDEEQEKKKSKKRVGEFFDTIFWNAQNLWLVGCLMVSMSAEASEA
jgi:hypothetical protein